MTPDEVDRALRSLLTEFSHTDATSLDPDGDLPEMLVLDSLSSLRMLAFVEKHFGVCFPDDQLSEFMTIRRLVGAIEDAQSKENST